jgi:hypothetical protein
MFTDQDLRIVCDAVSRAETFDPDEVLKHLEGVFSPDEMSDLDLFLEWVHHTGRVFGKANRRSLISLTSFFMSTIRPSWWDRLSGKDSNLASQTRSIAESVLSEFLALSDLVLSGDLDFSTLFTDDDAWTSEGEDRGEV